MSLRISRLWLVSQDEPVVCCQIFEAFISNHCLCIALQLAIIYFVWTPWKLLIEARTLILLAQNLKKQVLTLFFHLQLGSYFWWTCLHNQYMACGCSPILPYGLKQCISQKVDKVLPVWPVREDFFQRHGEICDWIRNPCQVFLSSWSFGLSFACIQKQKTTYKDNIGVRCALWIFYAGFYILSITNITRSTACLLLLDLHFIPWMAFSR